MHEGAAAGQHLEEEDAESVPVHGLAVALVHDDLGREVLWGPADGVGSLVVLQLLDEAEVRELKVA